MKATNMRTLTVSLTLHQAAMMQSAVETGGYASNSEMGLRGHFCNNTR